MQLSVRSGVAQSAISSVERGNKPLLETSERLAAAFGLDVDEFDPYARCRPWGRALSQWAEAQIGEEDSADYRPVFADAGEYPGHAPTLFRVLAQPGMTHGELDALEITAVGIEARMLDRRAE